MERVKDRGEIRRMIAKEIAEPRIDLPHIINRLRRKGVYEEDVRSVAWSMIDIELILEPDWSLTLREGKQ